MYSIARQSVCFQTMNVEQSDLDLSSGLPCAAPNHLGLQRHEEGFDGGIVATLALCDLRNLKPYFHKSFWPSWAQHHDPRLVSGSA